MWPSTVTMVVPTDSLLHEADAHLAAGVFREGMQAKVPSAACPEMVVVV